MELFIFRQNDFKRLYNCTGIDIDTIPLEKRKFVPEAVVSIILCCIYYILYVPCMISLWKHWKENTCYKFMFVIGVLDMSILWILGFMHSWLSIQGAVFCTHPTMIYWAGIALMGGWFGESSVDLMLALERCLEMIFPRLSNLLFSGYRFTIWLALCAVYALYWMIFQKPVLFNGIYFAWYFYPFIGYRNDTLRKFESKLHAYHDTSLAISMPTIYLIFAISFIIKTNVQQMHITKTQKMAFLQVFLFSFLNAMGGTVYALMQHTTPSQWLITVTQFIWFHIHGLPPVIYLLLNKTTRQDCYTLFFKVIHPNQITRLHGITILRRTSTRITSNSNQAQVHAMR